MTRTPLVVGLLAVSCGMVLATNVSAAAEKPFTATELASFDEPWAMTFLPDGSLLAIEKGGKRKRRDAEGRIGENSGVPQVVHGGEGGSGAVVLHPQFASNGWVYLRYAERDPNDNAFRPGGRGAAVARALWLLKDGADGNGGRLLELAPKA